MYSHLTIQEQRKAPFPPSHLPWREPLVVVYQPQVQQRLRPVDVREGYLPGAHLQWLMRYLYYPVEGNGRQPMAITLDLPVMVEDWRGAVLFIFTCRNKQGALATIQIHSVDWAEVGDVTFRCNDDQFACLLLTGCRADVSGFFNLLAGSRPLQVEQWLTYLEEKGELRELRCDIRLPDEPGYLDQAGMAAGQWEELLMLVYRIGRFNRLQITRYLKQRSNPSLLATRYGKEELERFRLLNEVIRLLNRLKQPASKKSD